MGVNLTYSLRWIVNNIFDLVNLLIIIRVLLSWLRPNPYAPGIRLLYNLTEPLLAPFRGLFPMGTPSLDISPVIALIFLQLLRRLLLAFLF